jgi:hypothetical protein
MEKKGQILLLIGVILSIASMVITRIEDSGEGWVDFLSGMMSGIAIVFVIYGIILVFRSKKKQK